MEKTNRNWVSIGSINSRLIYSLFPRLPALLMLEVASKQHQAPDARMPVSDIAWPYSKIRRLFI
jgi:hypothetical protein